MHRSRIVLLLGLLCSLIAADAPGVASAAGAPPSATAAASSVPTPTATTGAAPSPTAAPAGRTYTGRYVTRGPDGKPQLATFTRTIPASPKARGTGKTMPALTTTYAITSTADNHDASPGDGRCADSGGACTLRAAVEEANADPAGSTLTLTVPAGTYALTLGQLLVSCQSTIALNGAGSSSTTITANNVTRDFNIQAGVALTLSGVTITGGNAQDSGYGQPYNQSGGGIFNLGRLTLIDSVVTRNQVQTTADEESLDGGGITSVGLASSLTLTHTEVSHNTVSARSDSPALVSGGGIVEVSGPLTITDQSTITDNVAQGGYDDYARGGGFEADDSVVTISDSSVTGNVAGESAGMMVDADSSSTLTNVMISNNQAVTYDGGGVGNFGDFSMTGGAISNNTISAGGGAGFVTYCPSCAIPTAVTLANVTISGNVANKSASLQVDGYGAGISNDGSNITITGGSITENTAYSYGGGIENRQGPLIIANSTISNNRAQNGGGGGIVNTGTLILTNSSVVNNTAEYGVGLQNAGAGTAATITGSTFSNNHGHSGAMGNADGGVLSLTNSTITGNDSGTEPDDFNASLDSKGQLTLTNITYAGNSGGIYNFAGSSLAVRNSIIANTSGGPNCGGVITDQGHNLDSGSSCGFSQTTDFNNTNPLLGALADNGGSTQTMALQPGSSAIDAGGTSANGCPSTDQRGVSRPQGSACDIGAYEAPPSPPPPSGDYHPLPPVRILDTRPTSQIGPFDSPFTAGQTRCLLVAGQGGVPATGAAAVVLNVAVTDTTSAGVLTIYPSGQTRPMASNLNWSAGETIPNLVIVPVGADGKVCLYNALGSADVVIDLEGWYDTAAAGPAGRYQPLAPNRLLDTRRGTQVGPYNTPFTSGTIRAVQITGQGGVPSSGVAAVVLNVAVTNTTSFGNLTIYPAGQGLPVASNLNWSPGQTIPNRVLVPVGSGGQIAIAAVMLGGSADVVVDVNGWFSDSSGSASSGYTPLNPARILDTRRSVQVGPYRTPFSSNQARAVQITGQGGVPGSGVTAVVLNVAVTDATSLGNLTLYPSNVGLPLASDLNWSPNVTVANLVVVKVGPDGMIDADAFCPGGTVDVVVDVEGYFH